MKPATPRGARSSARVLLALLLCLVFLQWLLRRLRGLYGGFLSWCLAAVAQLGSRLEATLRPAELVGWFAGGGRRSRLRSRAAFASLAVLALLLACAKSLPAPQPPVAGRVQPPAAAVRAPSEVPAPRGSQPVEPSGSDSRVHDLLASSRLLRVGLATDLSKVELPSGSGVLLAEAEGRVFRVKAPLRVTAAAEILEPGFYRLQAAALKDERQARSLARQLQKDVGPPADVVFDAGSDLYRVRVGRYPTREAAEGIAGRLARQGLREAWVVSEKARLRQPALRILQGKESNRVPGRWLTLSVEGEDGIRIGQRRVRGRLLIYLNDRGSLNLVNELALEDYLRGVVPREMGPEEYDSLETLKAQAVAARTYTLNNLGEFAGEGYDICATPRCQVYGGMDAEHPLSDRAVAETAGEVMRFEGALVDALYSSTCGGHTEDVGVVFPQKNEPYLKGVACLEAGGDRLTGAPTADSRFPLALMQSFLPPKGIEADPEVLAARLEHLALLAGLPMPEDRLASLDRREVQRFLASIFDLVLDLGRLAGSDRALEVGDPAPAGWSPRDLRLAVYLRESGLLAGSPAEPLTAAQIEESLFRLALLLRVIERVEGRYQGIDEGALLLRRRRETLAFRLSENLATFRQAGGELSAGPLHLLPGDRLVLYVHGHELLAVAQQSDGEEFFFERRRAQNSWVRFRSDPQLSELVNGRYPGLGFSGLIIESRGVSGRVGKLRIEGEGEKSVEVEGLAIRWTLDLPDTLFTAERVEPPGRQPGWRFSGRGRGHGVGLCQVGAFGMGLRGHTYKDILEHYYTGVEISKLGAPPAGLEAASLR